MIHYRNLDTGEIIEREHPSPRLDALTHRWERLNSDDHGEHSTGDDEAPPRPGKGASRAVWADYDMALGGDPTGLTRDQIAARHPERP